MIITFKGFDVKKSHPKIIHDCGVNGMTGSG
jgi:hypothetical protein